ncbi:hypothetical protein QTP86_015437, partial [Hemibagrus guttatus]
TVLAKALYDNTAESSDELAFHKGDVVVVIKQTVEGSVGWWKCSLNGREGLAPANRLRLLSPSESIYQTLRPAEANLTYEIMDKDNKVVHDGFSPSAVMYAVASPGRKGSLYTMYAVPPTRSRDPNYDIPVPSNSQPHLKSVSYNSLPNPRKCEQIYDVPVASEMPVSARGFYGTMPSKGAHTGTEVYDTPPSCVRPAAVTGGCVYDIPKCSVKVQQRTDPIPKQEEGIYDVPPSINKREPILNVLTLPNQNVTSPANSENASKPLEYRFKTGPRPGRSSWGRQIMVSRELQERGTKTTEKELKNDRGMSVFENQRNSTVSTSSNTSSSSRSSCDSMMFGSPSPEPLREVTLSPEEATKRLLQLQETVCQAVPRLMNFVSSHWRSPEHLGQHLQEIRVASEDVANSVTSFLNFALDIRGNAQRLSDSNLQTRLQKQLSVVEDSGLIVQTSVNSLGDLGWTLDVLAQDPGQPQTPDKLERLVMVARTLPEDIKRLVSIINANSKLLFRNSSKEPEMPKNTSPPHVRKSLDKNEPLLDKEGDDDYVHLQDSKPEPTCSDSTSKHLGNPRPVISDHCRLYFGAIRKAIAVFVSSLEEQQPPEKFISHSKLVIMVGQRLIDTLFSEAQGREDSQELLCKSNHLCALLKQLAVATKKAALHFPEKMANKEAQDLAKELAQRANQFRMFLDN